MSEYKATEIGGGMIFQRIVLGRYKIVCHTPAGVLVCFVESYPTFEDAQKQADEFNQTRWSENVWTVEPLRYN